MDTHIEKSILELKDDVLDEFKSRMEKAEHEIDADDILSDAIESVLDNLDEELDESTRDDALDLLFSKITESDKGRIEQDLTDKRKDNIEYQRNPLGYHGLSIRDFY